MTSHLLYAESNEKLKECKRIRDQCRELINQNQIDDALDLLSNVYKCFNLSRDQRYRMDCNGILCFMVRDSFTKHFSWSIPTIEDVNFLVEKIGNRKVLGIGSGLALWEATLKGKGVDIIATDMHNKDNTFMEVEILSHNEAMNKYPDRMVFMSWPHFCDEVSSDVAMRFPSDMMIYIGEDDGGCCATELFFEIMKKYDKEMYNILQWCSLHDRVFIYYK